MTIKKKKRRKKRAPKQYELPETQEEKAKVQYRDDFQTTVGKKLEDFGSKLEGKGRMIMYGIGALIVLAVIAGLFYMSQRRADNRAQAALGEAIKTSSARITDAPQPPDAIEKVFKTKKERAEAAITELQNVSTTYGGQYAEKAAYLIAINRLDIDRAAGIKELEGIATGSTKEASMAKFALAQTRVDDGKLDEAAKLYSELLQADDPVISKVTINTALAKIYEKQGKKKEAVAIYFEIAKAASEAKDAQDKPIPLTQSETEAKAKLEELDPEKAKEIKEPEPADPGLPSGVLN
ncbi:MAG: hypothetical protein HKN33_13500 [Pyrinomonadaceae bacterium]|nr:hypothetical protein [Pyrinomonadaceae bacterium]